MAILDQAADMVAQGGIEAWSRATVEDILNQAGDHPEHYTKSTDILEVWFDSGSTFEHVLRGSHKDAYDRAPLPRPAAPKPILYLEGHDQHRGWFHSSLLVGLRPVRPRTLQRFADPRLCHRWPRPQDEQIPWQHCALPQEVNQQTGR